MRRSHRAFNKTTEQGQASHVVFSKHGLKNLVLLNAVLEIRVPNILILCRKGLVQPSHVASWRRQVRKVVRDRLHVGQRVRRGVVHLNAEQILAVVQRPRVYHVIVAGDAYLACRPEDSPLHRRHFCWAGRGFSVGKARRLSGQLVGQHCAGGEDGVKDDLVGDIVGASLVDHLARYGIENCDGGVLLDQQRLVASDLPEGWPYRGLLASCGGGVRGNGVFTLLQELDGVRKDDGERVAADVLVGKVVDRAGQRRAAKGAADKRAALHLADVASGDHGAYPAREGIIPPLQADNVPHIVRLGQVGEFLGLAAARFHRPLHEDVFARCDGRDERAGVPVYPYAAHDEVDARIICDG